MDYGLVLRILKVEIVKVGILIRTNVVCVAVVMPLMLIIESSFSSASLLPVRFAEFAGDTLKQENNTYLVST